MTYKIVYDEVTDRYLCYVMDFDSKVVGTVFTATSYEQLFAWLRLMIGNYPGTQEVA